MVLYFALNAFRIILAIIIIFLAYPSFDHVTDLPNLCGHLYWDYDTADSNLYVFFSAAAVAEPTGWVAWGISPTGSGLIGDETIVLSFDSGSNSPVVAKVVNFTSFQEIGLSESLWIEEVYNVNYAAGFIKFEANFVLPDETEAITHFWQSGSGDGDPSVQDMAEELSFGLINLTEAKKSTFLGYVDRLSWILSYEKACSLGRKSLCWEYYTYHNVFAALCHSFILLTIAQFIKLKKGKKSWRYWERAKDAVNFLSRIIILVLLFQPVIRAFICGDTSFESAAIYLLIGLTLVLVMLPLRLLLSLAMLMVNDAA